MTTLVGKINLSTVASSFERLLLLAAAAAIVVAVIFHWPAIQDGLSGMYGRTGLATIVLMPLSVALAAAIVNGWVTSDWHSRVVATTLETVAVLGPMTGFLGTTLGLMQAIDALGQAGTLDGLLDMVGHTFEGMGVAFSTTVWGLVLAIVAVFVLRVRPRPVSRIDSKETPRSNAQPHRTSLIESPLSTSLPGRRDSRVFSLRTAGTDDQEDQFGDVMFAPDDVSGAFASFGVGSLSLVARPRPKGIAVSQYETALPEGLTLSQIQRKETRESVAMKLGAVAIQVSPHEHAGKVWVMVEAHEAPEPPSPLREALMREDIQGELKRGGYRALVGQTASGHAVSVDLAEENLLIAGTSGAGKTNLEHQILIGLASTYNASQLQFEVMDPHAVELIGYAGIPHTRDVSWRPEQCVERLQANVDELDARYAELERAGCRTIAEYNQYQDEMGGTQMPLLVIVIDEVASVTNDLTTPLLERLAREGRKVGIRLIVCTQAVRASCLSGPTQANITARVCLKTTSSRETRQVLDSEAAPAHELKQPGAGYLICRDTHGQPARVNSFEVTSELITEVQTYWRGE